MIKVEYKVEKAGLGMIEKVINEQYKQGYDFVCFVPFLNSSGLFGKQQILFKKKK